MLTVTTKSLGSTATTEKKARKEKSLEISARGIYAITATRNERKQLDIYKT